MISFNLFKQGAIHIHSADFLYLSKDAFLLVLDCAQKYPDAMISWTDEFKGDENCATEPGCLTVVVLPDENTIHVPENAARESDGSYIMTMLEVRGLSGEWHITHERGKWGPYVYGIRRIENPIQIEPSYDCDGRGCNDGK